MRLNLTCYSCFVINNADQKDFSFVLCASALNTKVHTSASNVDPDEPLIMRHHIRLYTVCYFTLAEHIMLKLSYFDRQVVQHHMFISQHWTSPKNLGRFTKFHMNVTWVVQIESCLKIWSPS